MLPVARLYLPQSFCVVQPVVICVCVCVCQKCVDMVESSCCRLPSFGRVWNTGPRSHSLYVPLSYQHMFICCVALSSETEVTVTHARLEYHTCHVGLLLQHRAEFRREKSSSSHQISPAQLASAFSNSTVASVFNTASDRPGPSGLHLLAPQTQTTGSGITSASLAPPAIPNSLPVGVALEDVRPYVRKRKGKSNHQGMFNPSCTGPEC